MVARPRRAVTHVGAHRYSAPCSSLWVPATWTSRSRSTMALADFATLLFYFTLGTRIAS